jgi:primosomal protein N' (replication factor Y) (superfamily II helicase)
MNYYEVLVTTSRYHGSEPLTYHSDITLRTGHIVMVPVINSSCPAIIIRTVKKPLFKTKAIQSLLVTKELSRASLSLFTWLQEYYPSPLSTAASLLIPSQFLVKKQNTIETKQKSDSKPKPLAARPRLTKEQDNALSKIYSSNTWTFLLHGDTGSGKTRIYSELIDKAVSQGKSAIVLTPEISLTSQLSTNIQNHTTADVLILHSNLTPKEKRELWLTIHFAQKPQVIIGPRSALFAPVEKLGLIVVDECHDNAYKQDQSPYYSALRVAGALANIHGARLIYGSATPSVTEHYIAEQKQIPILRMKSLAMGGDRSPDICVIDAKDRSNYTKSSHISDRLIASIATSLQNGEQSLVFLNRRGTARLVMCQDCDWQALCPHCDLPLTYHGDSHLMLCHTCGYKQQSVLSCPVCASPEIIFKSIGTKAIASQLQRLFPEAKIKRYDTDNAKQDRFEHHYKQILNKDVDILVGTQMLVKGLDLPSLSVVGIVAADTSLYFPDYTAEEQTFQLLTQVIGRVSRGHRQGTVVVQTYDSSGTAQTAALQKDWESFYNQQLSERRKYMFPPYCYVLKLTCSRKSRTAASNAAVRLKKLIETLPLRATIIGPAPRFNERVHGNFNWQIIVKSKQRSDLLNVIKRLPANWSYDIDPTNLL